MESDSDAVIAECNQSIQRIHDMLQRNPQDWRGYINLARSLTSSIDRTDFMTTPNRVREQTWIISTLQHLAYQEPDEGGVRDIAEWCVAQWLQVLQNNPEDVETLQGLGQSWLSLAQRLIANIHREDGSSSSSGSLLNHRVNTSTSSIIYTASDDERDNVQATVDADSRLHNADYVEARGMLLPATDFFRRAVDIAEARGLVTGELLALAAEAFMSLGNVSYSSVNEHHFRQALDYLGRATRVPSYQLPSYLQHYLHEYGRLLN
ncbi:MAG: hypothetical protein M1834_002822 [Cirrosporium novae-zelandiae]|nr:MAG: hypothetical protein M1834_002822 [Cirrosporium novae-zelandiae]